MRTEANTRMQIVIFGYNRPFHLQACLSSLQENKEAKSCDLTIFVDGPKGISDIEGINQVLEIANGASGFRTVQVIRSLKNKGLAESIINGVSLILATSEQVIVLEDDLVVSPYFLGFMSQALQEFKNEKKVASIHGYLPKIRNQPDEPFFLRGADCWGWATWRDRWQAVEWNGRILREELIRKKLVREFNFEQSYNYFGMLERQIAGLNDSWAIRWHASMFLQNRLTLYPNHSLVVNTGMDGSGRHSTISNEYETNLAEKEIGITKIKVQESKENRREFKRFFKQNKRRVKGSFFQRARRKLIDRLAGI